jgi:Alginate lyase
VLTPAECAPLPVSSRAFIHPGGLHSRSNLERMRYQVAAEQEPWLTSFQQLAKDARARADYDVRGDASWTSVQRGGEHGGEFESDASAAYLNALMWAITGDEAHAKKCVEIFNTWKGLTTFVPGGTPALDAGLFAYKMVEAAEIIKSTYDGWSAADVSAFQDMLVYPGYSSRAVPDTLSDENGTFYWRIYQGDPGRHGNQDMIAWRAMLVMGVFLDNRTMFERALRYFKGEPHLAEDLPYPSGPSVSGAQLEDNAYFTSFERRLQDTTPDYGYNGVLAHYVWENGQLQESSRDQQHAFFGLGAAAGMAEVAWNQGDAVWSSLDQRLLKGFEFTARYNASYLQAFPDQPTPWEPSEDELIVRTDRTGRWRSKAVNPYFESDFVRVSRGDFPGKRPVFEQALAHFQVRMGLPASATLWTERARDVAIQRYGQEPNGFSLDHPGWGGLTFRRPAECAGDPISGFDGGTPLMETPVAPATIRAANYDFFPGGGEGHTYHDASPGNAGGQYRADDVDLGCSDEGDPVVVGLEPDEWLSYTIQVPRAGRHFIELTYAADGEAALRFRVDGRDVTEQSTLPGTAMVATARRVAAGIDLRAGVQSLRIVTVAASAGLQLHSFRLVAE